MADQRITQLTALPASGVADIDVLPIVDISASETKKVTAKDLVAAGVALINSSTIDIGKINQASATKLGTTSLADDAITAAKLADDSSVSTASVVPSGDNFEGRLWINTTDKTVQVYDAAAFAPIKVGASNYIAASIGTAAISGSAITYAKLQDVSATDRLLGRSSVGSGIVEEIVCTAAGRALIDDASASDQRTTLGLAIGTNVQAYDAALQSIAGLTTASGQFIYTTASDTYATTTLTSAGRDLLDDADVAAQRTTLGLGTIATQAANAVAITGGSVTVSGLTSTISSLGTATITGGSIAGITDLAVADGGTGASTAADARTNLGLAIGTNVQAYDPALQSIAGLTTAANQLIYTTASDTYATTSLTSAGRALLDDADVAAQRTTLGLGTIATQNVDAVAITGGSATLSDITSTNATFATANINGGSITGIADLAIADGGTGASTVDDARANLGLGTLATQNGTFSGISSGTNTGDQTITLTGDVTGTGTGTFAATIANDAITGAKLADGSATVISGNAPSGVGAFAGQQWINTNTGFTYIWDGSAWQRTAGLQTITFSDTTPLSFNVSYPDNFSAVITSAMESQSANAVLVGPISGSAATPTFRSLTATDLPIATSIANGASRPGTGLNVTGLGVLNHSNSVTAGTYTKVVIDAQGHVSNGTVLSAVDIPNLDASIITSGTFDGAFLRANSVSAVQLADNGIAQVSETQPVPEFAGQWWINPGDRSAYIWVGTVSPNINGYWLNLGFGAATQYNLRFGGTYNATTNLVVSLNQYGTEAGLTVGGALSAPSQLNAAVYLICTTAGTGTSPAPVASLSIGDWVLSQGTGSNWTKVGVVSGAVSISDYQVLCDGTYFTPDMTAVADVRGALSLLWGRAQIASTVQLGVVLESSEVLVDNTTGEMTIGTVDEGTY
jgi:hypothetical protein